MDLFYSQEKSETNDFYKNNIKESWRKFMETLGKYSEFCEIVDMWYETPLVMIKQMYKLVQGSNATQSRPLEYFITISFDDKKIDPKNIPKYMEGVIKKKWVESYIYCIEQRSEEEDVYYGYHVHILIKPNKKIAKSDVIREIYSTLKKYMEGQNYIDVQKVNHRQNIINYMKGEKNEMKLEKSKNDKPFRQKNNLEDIYIKA